MNPIRSSIRRFPFANWEIVLMRAFFALVMLDAFPRGMSFSGQPYPVGLARYFDLTFLCDPGVSGWLHWVFVGGLAVYVSGRGLAVALPVLTLLLSAAGALNNSQGATTHHLQIVGLVALMQSIWYCRPLRLGLPLALAVLWPIRAFPSDSLKLAVAAACLALGWWLWRIAESRWTRLAGNSSMLENHRAGTFLALQAVVAVYVVSGLTKVITSGLAGWIGDSRYFPLQLIKTERSDFYNTLAPASGGDGFLDALPQLAGQAMSAYPVVAAVVLGAGLILELGAWAALLSRGWAAVAGLLLIAFHLSVSKLMNLNFTENMWVLLIFFVNVPYWIARLARAGRPAPVGAGPADPPPPAPGIARRLAGALRGFAPAAVLAVLLLAVRENYPFSHFPMYSSFSDYTYYMLVSGSDGNPLPIETLTAIRTGRLKKVYDRELDRIRKHLKESDPDSFQGLRFMTRDQRRPAAEITLDWLLENCSAPARRQLDPLRPLQITQVELFLAQGMVRENRYSFSERQQPR